MQLLIKLKYMRSVFEAVVGDFIDKYLKYSVQFVAQNLSFLGVKTFSATTFSCRAAKGPFYDFS
jgi:hypothetical protein